MKLNLIAVSIIIISTMCVGSCVQKGGIPLAASIESAQAVPDFTAGFEWAVPILHETFWPPAPLSKSVCYKIHRSAESVMPADARIWFVLSIPGPGANESDTPNWNVNVYFSPQKASGRICKGKFFSMNSIFNNVPLKENGLYKPSLQNYWHVLSSGDSFTNSLPSSPAMPFEVSGNLPDQEVVELVDMVRPKEDDPIADIRLQDDGRVVVMTATSRAFLAGRGKKLLFEKKNGKWVLVEECNWMS